MKWSVPFVLLVVGLAGCHAPKPSMDLLAPFGSTRVAPPSTNSVGGNPSYYNRTAPAATAPSNTPATGTAPGAPGSTVPPATTLRTQPNAPANRFAADEAPWRAIRSKLSTNEATPSLGASAETGPSPVVPASFTTITPLTPSSSAAVGTGVTGSEATKNQSSLKLGGMPVTDTTQPSAAVEPRRFQPAEGARELSQLPKPISSATTAGIAVASAQSSDRAPTTATTPAPASTEGQTTLQWRTRPSTSASSQ